MFLTYPEYFSNHEPFLYIQSPSPFPEVIKKLFKREEKKEDIYEDSEKAHCSPCSQERTMALSALAAKPEGIPASSGIAYAKLKLFGEQARIPGRERRPFCFTGAEGPSKSN